MSSLCTGRGFRFSHEARSIFTCSHQMQFYVATRTPASCKASSNGGIDTIKQPGLRILSYRTFHAAFCSRLDINHSNTLCSTTTSAVCSKSTRSRTSAQTIWMVKHESVQTYTSILSASWNWAAVDFCSSQNHSFISMPISFFA